MVHQSKALFEQITEGLKGMNDKEKKDIIKKTNGIFELHIKDKGGEELVWTIDLKKGAEAYEGKAKNKADVTIDTNDDTFMQMAEGNLNGQKAFLSGKLKVKGNIMCVLSPPSLPATPLDSRSDLEAKLTSHSNSFSHPYNCRLERYRLATKLDTVLKSQKSKL
ncbi:hypothetical protein ACQY0O_000774 [Thecaphora frezii]